jgi:ribosomal protein L16 Arg81 hydroxylase
VHGRKRWALMPPSSDYTSPVDVASVWWEGVRPGLLDEGWPWLHECVQEAGDLLYVPSAWYHAVYNLMPTVSLAVQVGAPTSWANFGIDT